MAYPVPEAIYCRSSSLLCLHPAHPNESAPISVVMVLDTSGSMGNAVEANLGDGRRENNGFNRLDLVKHATRTVVAGLRPGIDRIGIISFSSEADTVAPLAAVSPDSQIGSLIERMQPESSTNIWAGLCAALDMLNHSPEQNRRVIMLLTDGQPNVGPARGIVAELERMRAYRVLPIIHTFCFTYSGGPDTSMMCSVADITGGTYFFVPDAGMVGTCFIHALANTRCAVTERVETDEQKVTGMLVGGYPHVELIMNPVTHLDLGGGRRVPVATEDSISARTAVYHETHMLVRMATEAIKKAVFDRCEDPINECIRELSVIPVARVRNAQALYDGLLHDLKGEVRMAMQPEHYRRWGEHYVQCYLGALHRQQRVNFKDKVGLAFGDFILEAEIDRLTGIFDSMPPPKPSFYVPPESQVSSMASYNDSHGGCFDGDALASMADGTTKPVRELKRGDKMYGGGTIQCVIRQPKAYCRVVKVPEGGALLITPYHPVRTTDTTEWVFPNDIALQQYTQVAQEVWNVMLEEGEHHFIRLNGAVDCVTLAHGIKGHPVLSHKVFGSPSMRATLRAHPDWDRPDGVITLNPDEVKYTLATDGSVDSMTVGGVTAG